MLLQMEPWCADTDAFLTYHYTGIQVVTCVYIRLVANN